MKTKILIIKKGTIWAILLISLVFLSRIACSEEREGFKPKLSIKLMGGLRYMNVGDLNTYLESFDNHLYNHIYYYKGGKIGKINNYGYDLEGELRLDISSKFAIAIGVGYMSGKSKSDFQTVGFFPFQTPPVSWYMHEFILEPKLKTIPLKLGIYYMLPLSSRINLFLNSGLGYYFSTAYLYKYHWFNDLETDSGAPPAERYETYEVSSNDLGYHGGIGFEYNISNHLTLVLEVQGRYTKIKNLKGIRDYYYSWILNGKEEGILYIGERDMTDVAYGNNSPDLIISQSRPSGDGFQNIRKAVLDFSGASFRLGIRIKLF